MGKVIIQEDTTKEPIQMIGKYAGECGGADTHSREKNFNRGIACINNEHGRTGEFPDVYLILDGYSARTIREGYTHIGGAPTRVQASTRYINYEDQFDYVIPPRIANNSAAKIRYEQTMRRIQESVQTMLKNGVPREDCAMLLPLGMETRIACKHNFRNLVDMSHQRTCSRAYWEYRQLFSDIIKALSEYSDEGKILATNMLKPKCEVYGYCPEEHGCGRTLKKEKKTIEV